MSAFARARELARQNIADHSSSEDEADISEDDLDVDDNDIHGIDDDDASYESLSGSDDEEPAGQVPLASSADFLMTSTWTPKANNSSPPDTNGWRKLVFKSEEQATFLGQYEFRVVKGVFNIAGALCRDWPNPTYRVFAPSSHSLPAIQCVSDDGATIEIRQTGQSIRKLAQLSPLFRRIWSHSSWTDSPALHDISQRGFSYVTNALYDPLKRPLQPLVIDDAWQRALNTISLNKCSRDNPMTFVLGHQGMGKSTFCRLLLNRMLTLMRNDKERLFESICYLDLDSGQSEFTPCAQVSLVQVTKPVLGPPFTHCVAEASATYRVLRAHAVSATSVKDDVDRVTACAQDLLQRYSYLSAVASIGPLIINTPGTMTGLALDALLDIMKGAKPDHVVLLAKGGDENIINVNRALEGQDAQLHALHRKTSVVKSRTAAHLRDMQAMSYFHASNLSDGRIKWHAVPVCADTWKFVALRFSGEETNAESKTGTTSTEPSATSVVLGVASLAEQPPVGQLVTVIDGNVLAATYIEDDETLRQVRLSMELEPEASPNVPQLSASKTRHLLQPGKCNLVGLVMVQRITSTELTVHTPDQATLLRACATGRVILIRRNVEAPGWAYTEPVYLSRSWRQRDNARWRAEMVDSRDEEQKSQLRKYSHLPDSQLQMDEVGAKWVSHGKRKAGPIHGRARPNHISSNGISSSSSSSSSRQHHVRGTGV